MSLNEQRILYRQIRNRSEARTPAEFDAAVKAYLEQHRLYKN